MKPLFFAASSATSLMQIPAGLGVAFALTFLSLHATAQEVNLKSANNFGVLAGSTITSTGSTVINGGLGLTPGSSVTGSPTVNGPTHIDDATAVTAQNDLIMAYNTAAGLPPNLDITGQNLGGMTLTPGVYRFASSAQLTGTLTLDGGGSSDPIFVFQIGSTLTTDSNSSVVTINDQGSATPGISVYWQVGSSATLGGTTAFEGTIMALESITAVTGATVLDGRLLARNGAVTLDHNVITAPPAELIVPEPRTGIAGALMLLPFIARRLSPLFKRRVA